MDVAHRKATKVMRRFTETDHNIFSSIISIELPMGKKYVGTHLGGKNGYSM